MNFILNFLAFIIINCIFFQSYVKSQSDPSILVQLRRYFFRPLQSLQDWKKSEVLLQDIYPTSTPFFCDAKFGPGKRSSMRPSTVHELRPGDIDIIMGMGDSLTAGNGILGRSVIDILIENRGLSWSIGGQGTWRKYMTLPNILKEFNPNLYGYSLNTSLSADRASRFNVAEGGAMSRDMPYQAQVLIQRLRHDPKVNMTNDWKLLTIFIGGNDFCSDICYYTNPKITVKKHERHLLKALRILRDNIPRLFVNVVIPPNVEILKFFTNKPPQCLYTHIFECGCFMTKSKNDLKLYRKIVQDWIKKDYDVIAKSEFNTKDFTVNIQPFTTTLVVPKFKNGSVDYSYLSADCFHFSQKQHKIAAISLWNNMLEPNGKKMKTSKLDIEMKCPTEEMPYLKTRDNSILTNISSIL